MAKSEGKILHGQEYDKALAIAVPYTQQEVTQGSGYASGAVDVDIINKDVARERVWDVAAATAALDAHYVISPSMAAVKLPNTLVSVDAIWNKTESDADMALDYTGGIAPALGLLDQLATLLGHEFSLVASAAVTGDFNRVYRPGFAEVIPVELHSFYMPFASGTLNPAAILTKINTKVTPIVVGAWPTYREVTDSVVLTGGEQQVRVSVKIAAQFDNGTSNQIAYIRETSRSGSVSMRTLELEPSIHDEIIIGNMTLADRTATGVATDFAGHTVAAEKVGTLSKTTIAATDPAVFPTGYFLYDTDVQPVDFGYARVIATVVHVTSSMV